MIRSRFVAPGLAAAAVAAGVVLANPAEADAQRTTCRVNLGDAAVLANNGRVNVPLVYNNIVPSQRIVTRCREVADSVRNAYARYIRSTAGNPLPRAFSTGWYFTNWRVTRRNPQAVRFVGRFRAADNPGVARINYTIRWRGPVTRSCTTQFNTRWVPGDGRVTAQLRYQNISPFQIDVTSCSTARHSMAAALNWYLNDSAGQPQQTFPTPWFAPTSFTVGPSTTPGAAAELSVTGRFQAADNPGQATLVYTIPVTQAAVDSAAASGPPTGA